MKQLLAILLALLPGVIDGSAETSADQPKSPKAVVEEYWKFETEGGHLTDAGWKKGDTWRLRPSPPPAHLVTALQHYARPQPDSNHAEMTLRRR